jgi:bacterioferritin-associated ferredoxin
MIICVCRGRSDRDVDAAIACGARTLRDLAERCDAGTDCGGCRQDLTERLVAARLRDARDEREAA